MMALQRDEFLSALRQNVPLRFDDHSRIYAPFTGVRAAIVDQLNHALAPEEAVSYGLHVGGLTRVQNSDAYEGTMTWWLVTNRAVLEARVDAQATGTTVITVTRRHLDSLRTITLTATYAPGSTRFLLTLDWADGPITLDSTMPESHGSDREAIRRFAAAITDQSRASASGDKRRT